MATKLTLTPEAQAKVDEMLASEPGSGAVPQGPVLPLGRNASLARLVTEADARDNSIVARAEASVSRFTTATNLRLASIWRYGLIATLVKVYYWKVSWHELAYRTERKLYLHRPAYWTEEAS